MKITPKKKKAAFVGYPEVRAVAAMTDEELRLALAEYGAEPLTRLPGVIKSLTTDNQQTPARTMFFAFYRSITGLLQQPRTIGELTGFALLLICFGIIISLRVPVDSIAPVALQGFAPPPPIHSNQIVIVIDSSGSLSQLAHSKKGLETESTTSSLATRLAAPTITSFATHGLLDTAFNSRFDPIIRTVVCDDQTCDGSFGQTIDANSPQYLWYRSQLQDYIYTPEFKNIGLSALSYKFPDSVIFAHIKGYRSMASQTSMLWDASNGRHLSRRLAYTHEHFHIRSQFEQAMIFEEWGESTRFKNWLCDESPGYRTEVKYERILVGAHSFAPTIQEKVAQIDPLDEHHDLIESHVIGRTGFRSFQEHFLHP